MMRLLLVGSLFLFAVPVTALEPPLTQVGFAKVDITPPTPIRMTGYGSRNSESEGVAQKLFARAIAIGDGKDAAVLVAVDILGIPAAITEEVAARLKQDAGLPRDRFTLCSTHTHCGPALTGIAPLIFQTPITPEQQQRIDAYSRHLTFSLHQVVMGAIRNQQPAKLEWGQGRVGFAMNRRMVENGKWVKIGDNKDGRVDHDLPVLRITAPDGKVRGVVVNYACHCTTLGGAFNKIHGDWAGFASEILEGKHPGAVALITIGCGGDANPFPRGSEEAARTNGQTLADAVAEVLAKPMTLLPDLPVCKLARLDIPLAALPTREQWEERAKGKGKPAEFAKLVLERLARGDRLPTTVPYVVQSWVFGDDLAMVFLAGEVVVDYSLRLKKELDGKRLWVSAYSNDVPCYIASKRILPEGGYEVEGSMIYYDRPGPLAPEAEDAIIAAVKQVVPKEFLAAAQKKAANYVEELGSTLKPTRTVVYKKVGDRELHLHLFEPAGHKPTDRRGCVLNIHGGGWTSGNAQRMFPYGDHFAKHGLLGVSLEYRLLDKKGTTPFDCVKDGRSAVRYLKSHAAELGIDPEKIVVTGGSAGGHVAAGTALFEDVDEASDDLKISPVPAALVLYYPVIDTSKEGYGTGKCGANWKEISPLHRVKGKVPPTIIFHGTGDTVTPFKGAVAFQEAMKVLGNRCELIVNEGGKHGYFIYERGLFEDALKRTDEFLKAADILRQ